MLPTGNTGVPSRRSSSRKRSFAAAFAIVADDSAVGVSPSRSVQCRVRVGCAVLAARALEPKLLSARTTDVQHLARARQTRRLFDMGRDSRVYVKASPEEQAVFRAVATALGQSDNMSAAIRLVMFERARALGVHKPAKRTGKGGSR